MIRAQTACHDIMLRYVIERMSSQASGLPPRNFLLIQVTLLIN